MKSISKIEKIDILTGIRFFAAIHVVLFHNFSFFGLENTPAWITNFIFKGEAAVSFFFILSGYILTHAYQERLNDSTQKKKYFLSRLAKLYPLYFLAFIIDLPRGINYFFSEYTLKEAVAKTFISSIAHLSMLQSWIPRVTASWNPPAWSLSCEMFFYLIFIFTMKPLLKTSKKALLLFLLYIFPISLYFAFKYSGLAQVDSSLFHTFWRSFPLFKINEFFIGILLYSVCLKKNKLSTIIQDYGGMIFWGSIILSIILTTAARSYVPRSIFSNVLYVPIFSLIIISSQKRIFWGKKYFESKLIVHLGLISYALYILHQPLANYFTYMPENSISKGLFYLVSITVVAHLLYTYIEKPCHKKLSNLIKQS